MQSLLIPRRRTTKPEYRVGVDWANPITNGIVFAVLPGWRYDAVAQGTNGIGPFISAAASRAPWGSSMTTTGANPNGLLLETKPRLGPLWDSTVFSMWATTTTASANGRAIYDERPVTGNDIYKIELVIVGGLPQVSFTYRDDGNRLIQLRTPATGYNNGQTHTGAIIRNNSVFTAFYDGTSTSATNALITNSFTNANIQTTIGYDAPLPLDSQFIGRVDIVVGWNRALTINELKILRANPWQIFSNQVC
jgi:hypothetical protein